MPAGGGDELNFKTFGIKGEKGGAHGIIDPWPWPIPDGLCDPGDPFLNV